MNDTAVKELVNCLDRLLALDQFSVESIEQCLGVQLNQCETTNRFYQFYAAVMPTGLFTEADYREPGADATESECLLVLKNVRGTIAPEQLSQEYGGGQIVDVIPNAGPHGLMYYRFDRNGNELTLGFDALTKELLSATLRKPH